MQPKLITGSIVLACVVPFAAAVPALAATPTVKGSVGPGTAIAMSVKPKRAGTYKLVVKDTETGHNFHLTGPGVNVATGVPATGTKTFTVKLRAGATYKFVCDPHAGFMKGSFKVPK
jgi:plastocyanin